MTVSVTGESYYVAHEARLLKDLRQKLPFFRRALSTRLPEGEVEHIIQQTQETFRAMLSRLPYIGGKQNPLTTNLVACAWFLALYRVLQPRGLSDDEIGNLVYRVAEEWVKSSPRWLGRLQGLLVKTPLLRIVFGRISRQSQQRKYPGDFVVQFVPGLVGRSSYVNSQPVEMSTFLLRLPQNLGMGQKTAPTQPLGTGRRQKSVGVSRFRRLKG